MEDTYMIEISMPNGTVKRVNLITYLISDDVKRHYVVYSENETYGDSDDRIIYVSKLLNDDNMLSISEISDDTEWVEVQRLLRRIANVAK